MSCDCPFKDPKLEDMKKLDRYNWNVTLGKEHKPMQVYRIDGCIHTKGGKRGTNELYMADRNIAKEDIKPGDLTPFSGDICWGVNIQQHNYYGKDEVRVGCGADITCGGRKIYHITCSFDYIAARAMDTILKLQEECPIPFGEIDFEKWVLGKKIFWHDQPAVVTSYNVEDGTVFIKPIGQDTFKLLNRDKKEQDWVKEYATESCIKDDILASSIWWWREECKGDIEYQLENIIINTIISLPEKVLSLKLAEPSGIPAVFVFFNDKLYNTTISLESIEKYKIDVSLIIANINSKLKDIEK